MTRFGRGLVVGKFLPFHKGHELVVREALRQCAAVTVLVGAKAEQPIPGELRGRWIRVEMPAVEVVVVDQDARELPEDDSRAWAEAAVTLLGGRPDAVFTSEPYGDEFARELECVHVAVDPDRRAVPVSGTAIRADPLAHLRFLPPSVRASYVRRVCILGAESTGKTTLARALAERLETVWVPEYGAAYHHVGRPEVRGPWTTGELVHIARIQNWLEDFLAGHANRVLVCDTDAFTTGRFHELYLDAAAADVDALVREYDLYLLCDPETPFAQDALELRREDARRWMHGAYAEHARTRPHLAVRGPHEERVEAAAEAIERLLAEPVTLLR